MERGASFDNLIKSLFKADALGFDAGDYLARPTGYFKSQMISLAVLAGTLAIVPLGTERLLGSAILVSLMVALYIARERLSPEYADGVSQWLILSVTLSICAILPVLVPAGAVAVAVIVVGGARDVGAVAYLLLAIGSLSLFAIHLAEPAPLGYLPIIAVAMSCPSVIKYAGWTSGQYDLKGRREQMLLQSGRALAWEFDITAGELLSISGPTEELLGYDEETALVKLNTESPLVGSSRGEAPTAREWNFKITHADGSDRWFQVSARTRKRADGLPIAFGVAIDITKLERSRRNEAQRANKDSLTGLANRNGLAQFLDDAADKVGRAVLVIDLNGFKEVNDSLGHPVGDRLIAAVAGRLQLLADEDVCLARLGGDEFAFAVVAGNAADADAEVEDLARSVGECLKGTFSVGGFELRTSGAVGLASGSGLDWAELLRRADGAMYTSKHSGKAYEWYDQKNDQNSAERLHLRADLQRNLEDQVVLHYQPIICAESRRIVSIEALARWEHPERGMLYPDVFLPLMDAADGLRFDRHVMTVAVRTASELGALANDIAVAANLRPQSLRSPTLLGELRKLLLEHPLAAGRLVLEVTEQGLVDDPERLLPSLDALKEMGVRLAIDDFGTGASSLIRLRSLPFDLVKIDRSFVSRVPDDPIDTTIVRSTIELAHDLGMKLVAEGVETIETAEALKNLGCDKLQGWAFDKSMPLDELIDKYELSTGTLTDLDTSA